MLSGKRDYSLEILTDEELQHEYIMTRLRTQWGISLEAYQARFGEDARAKLLYLAEPFLSSGTLLRDRDLLRLTSEGIFVSDGIIASLFC